MRVKTKIFPALIVLAIAFLLAGCGGAGSSQSFKAADPVPGPGDPTSAGLQLTALTPSSAMADGPAFQLKVAGSGFAETPSTIYFGPNALSTILVNDSLVIATVPASMIATPGSIETTVRGPSSSSNAIAFEISPAVPSIVPAADTLGPHGTRRFVTVGFDSAVAWSIEEGSAAGTITSDGFYTAPAQIGTFHVIATSLPDSSTSATATITVTNSGFSPTGAMHVARSGHTATLLKDGRVLILGGGDSTAELFDPTSGAFSFTGAPVTGRLGATATLLLDGRVLIAGGLGLSPGQDGFLPFVMSAEIFDPETGTFRSTGNLVQTRANHSATRLADGRVLIAGGYKGLCITPSAEIFDPATESFSSVGFMLSGRAGHTATLLETGEVLLAGGANGCRPDAADDPPWDPLFVELFDSITNTFQAAGNMSTTRIGHSAIPLPNGKILMIGGIPSVQNLHQQPPDPSYAELYDAITRAFSRIPGLSISHDGYTATLLVSGMILIAGGTDKGGNITSDVELLDTARMTLMPTGALATPRAGHRSTLLQDGRVLITGGGDPGGNALRTAELYK